MMKGNEAIGEGALRAGCRFYFGYPITPQNELLEYMARKLPAVSGCFLQSESELAGASMLYGAAAAGKRVMTSSSSPGISLMQETISYLASAELPAVIVNITRGSPGLGRITPAQSDYNQATKGGGHGDYNILVFAPSSVQEMMDLTILAFELADHYRIPAMILGDGIVGQMMESLTLRDPLKELPPKPWAVGGCSGRRRNLVISAPFTDEELILLNERLQEKYSLIRKQEQRFELVCMEDADYIVVAFGIVSRLAHSAVESLRQQGYRVGMIRPVTLWPFPEEILQQYGSARGYLVVEMNEGQMLLDVKLALNGRAPVKHFGRGGGWLPSPQSIEEEMLKWIEEVDSP
jgi:2-oxoglutarate/2-oxoacid ferredoxin oxidoreductase subunit alpha